MFHVLCVKCQVSGVRCQVPGVRCKMSSVHFHGGHVACHMSITPTATASDPPLANSYDQEINFFRGQFLNSEFNVLYSLFP